MIHADKVLCKENKGKNETNGDKNSTKTINFQNIVKLAKAIVWSKICARMPKGS